MRKLLAALVAVLFSASAFAAGLPSLPSSPTYSEASQIVGTINALIQQLNGQTGYAPAQFVPVGSFCSATTATTTDVCTGQRGTAAYTAQGTIAAGGVVTETITNTLVTTSSVCMASMVQQTVAASSEVTVASVTPTAGSLAVVVQNPTATATGATGSWTIAFNCIN